MADKEEIKQAKRENKGVVVPPHLVKPYSPENIHLSKAQYIAKEKIRKEKALKVAEFEASLDKKPEEQKTPVVEEKREAKKRGRPKRIE